MQVNLRSNSYVREEIKRKQADLSQMKEVNLMLNCAPVDQLAENCADNTNVMGFTKNT